MDSDDEIKGAELVSTGLHGIQISELGEDESSRCIEVSVFAFPESQLVFLNPPNLKANLTLPPCR